MKGMLGRNAALLAALLMKGGGMETGEPLGLWTPKADPGFSAGDGRRMFVANGQHPALMTPSQRRRLCPGRDCLSRRRAR